MKAVKLNVGGTALWVLPRGKEVVALVAGVVIAFGAASMADDSVATVGDPPCGELVKAQSDALNYRMGMIQATHVDTEDFFKDSGCLGGLALMNIDLSNFISDFGSAMKSAAMAGWEATKKMAIDKGCSVAREKLAPMVDTYNEYAKYSDVKGTANSVVTPYVNQQASKVNAEYGTNLSYSGTGSSTPQQTTTVTDVLSSGVTNASAGAASSSAATSGVTTGASVF